MHGWYWLLHTYTTSVFFGCLILFPFLMKQNGLASQHPFCLKFLPLQATYFMIDVFLLAFLSYANWIQATVLEDYFFCIFSLLVLHFLTPCEMVYHIKIIRRWNIFLSYHHWRIWKKMHPNFHKGWVISYKLSGVIMVM